MSCDARKPVIGFRTMSDTNWSMQPQKMARCFIFRIYEEEGLYHPCSENKVADQLCSYCTADLRLCFRIGKMLFFSLPDLDLLQAAKLRNHMTAYDRIYEMSNKIQF